MSRNFATNEDLIEDLKKVCEKIGKLPTIKEYNQLGEYSSDRFTSRKKWIEWLKLAFGENIERTNSMRIPKEKLAEDLKRVKELIGKIPSKNDYYDNGKYSLPLFAREKSWNEWLVEIFGEMAKDLGKAPTKISNEDLIQNLKDLSNKLGRIPHKYELNMGKYCAAAYKRVFGSFGRALVAAGLKNNFIRDITNEEILADIKYVYEKLGHTPSLEEYYEHSNIKLSCSSFIDKFGSWNKALLKIDIPIETARNVTKQDIIDALKIWYEKNNKDVRCLEYWKIRKARENREFPYSPETIRHKFCIPWEGVMRECGFDYTTTDQFVKRGFFPGLDGNIYLSSIEKQVGDILFKLKNENKIIDYKYEAKVCEDRNWTCDFKMSMKNKIVWLEIDGMINNRKDPYNSGQNEKIEYYKANNFIYFIISYRSTKLEDTICKLL